MRNNPHLYNCEASWAVDYTFATIKYIFLNYQIPFETGKDERKGEYKQWSLNTFGRQNNLTSHYWRALYSIFCKNNAKNILVAS